MFRYVKKPVTSVSECVYFRLPSGFILYFHRLAAPLFLLGFALPSLALTLGQPQGAAWVGRPLDVVIPISLGEGERQDALCAEAEVLQGTTRIEDKRVTVSVGPGAQSGQLRLHVRSTVAVDEPVVQLTVRAGCEMNSTRQYVLLADMPAEVGSVAAASMPARALPASGLGAEASGTGRGNASSNASAGQAPSTTPANAPVRRARPAAPQPAPVRNRDNDRAEGSRPASGATPQRRAPAAARPPVAAAPRVVASAPASQRAANTSTNATAATPAASAATTGARLQLDALDPASVRNPTLAASAPGLTLPSGGDAAIAAAALAASAAANAEELQRATQRMQALEATLAALREQSTQNQRMLVEMRSELAEARDSRYRNPLVYVLVLLLLLALVALVMLWRMARGSARPAWWGDAPLKDDGGPTFGQPVASAAIDEERAAATPPVAASTVAAHAVVESFDEAPDTVPPAHEDDSTPARYVNTEELFDVQQQSDFFVSLGQHDQAIAVLSEHIADNPETSALAYLDLLRIYHSLDRRDDYARVGREFERAFNAQVPVFEQFAEVGNGLEHYRATLARIEAQWPQPSTLGLIEELVFRKPGTRGDESFDLAAYRELLLLYSVAKEVIDPDSAPPTPVTPLSFLDTHDAELEPSRLAMVAPEGYLEDTQPDGLHDDMLTVPGAALPSFYNAIDKDLAHDTVLGSGDTVLSSPADVAPRDMSDRGNEIEFDTTAFETVPGALEAPVWPNEPIVPATEPPLDLDLFDPLTEAEIAPKPKRRN